MADVSILLLTKNARRDLELVLPAVFAQRQVIPFEVIAIDSGSNDGSLEILRRFPIQVRQISAQQFHHARTRNLAASIARGNILVFLSQDAVPASDLWLKMLIENFADPKVAAVYGRQFPKPGSSVEREDALDTIYGDKKVIKDPAHQNGMGYRFYHFSDVNAAIRRTVWEEEHFPEDMSVFEDLGIAKQILDRGWKIVYEPQAAVFHSHSHTTIALFKRYFDIGYTLKRLRIWEAPGTRNSMLRDVWRLLKNKFRRARNRRTRQSARRGIKQEIAKCFGLFLGLNETLLPLILKRRLSAYRVFG
jgi:rhamnosyltransferase